MLVKEKLIKSDRQGNIAKYRVATLLSYIATLE